MTKIDNVATFRKESYHYTTNKAPSRTRYSTTKKEFAASFVRALKHGTRIATDKEKATGNARELIKQIRAEID
jgi:hypothetical protein